MDVVSTLAPAAPMTCESKMQRENAKLTVSAPGMVSAAGSKGVRPVPFVDADERRTGFDTGLSLACCEGC